MTARSPRIWLGLALVALGMVLIPVHGAGKKSDAEVNVKIAAAKPDAGKQVITIHLDVNKGWHIYSNPVGNEDLAAAQTVVTVRGKTKPASVKIDYPKAHVIDDKVLGKYGTYAGKVTIKATVQRAEGDTGPLEVSVRFQACNDRGSCLFPATVKEKVP
ncbi:MAG: protein-disulfide reductase DsbD N-terminal domain-containing protein [Gemmataceae bacterium]|nr:protein-disulfide reductase DsbD N-terminal domain-containing protein [Gemmataceae bacterium]